MTTTQKKKRNHWVPQSYLRYFAADDARTKIWAFSKVDGDPELKPIAKVAVKFYLYAPGSVGSRDYSFEDKLADLEQWFSHPVWTQIATGYADLSDDLIRKMISLTMAVMYLRNPAQLDVSRHIHERMRSFIGEAGALPDEIQIGGVWREVDKSSWEEFRDANDEDTKANWLKSVGSATWLAELFLKMRWMIVVADEPTFVTTDNPVTAVHRDLKFRGFANPRTSVMFPLSPTRLLCLDHLHEEPDSQYYPVVGKGESHNLLLWRNALDKMFSSRPIDTVLHELVSDAERQGY